MPKSRHSLRWVAAALAGSAVMGGLALAAEQQAGTPPGPERFTANAINMGTVGGAGGRTAVVQVSIDRWSTEQERQTLIKAFQERGPAGLLEALQKTQPTGRVRTGNTLGWDLHYAVQAPSKDGGRHVLIATDRVVGFGEVSRGARTMDYPFTLIELHLDKDGKGKGKIALATKIARSKDGQRLELENYSSEPVRLQNVRPQK